MTCDVTEQAEGCDWPESVCYCVAVSRARTRLIQEERELPGTVCLRLKYLFKEINKHFV